MVLVEIQTILSPIKKTDNRTKAKQAMACDNLKNCINKRYSDDFYKFMDHLLWRMSGFFLTQIASCFVFQIKYRDSNEKNNLGESSSKLSTIYG